MDSRDIQKWQAEQIHDRISPTSRYLIKIIQRLDSIGFSKNDSFYQSLTAARDGLHDLWVSTHYLSSCDGAAFWQYPQSRPREAEKEFAPLEEIAKSLQVRK